ncbi:MAG: efflux transporter outer membrane subunit [Enhydrobacter sp.]|nr:efflux transporter outer membrane subunit [Enhydrobacter sp.]
MRFADHRYCRRLALSVATIFTLSGCGLLGPDYKRPPLPDGAGYSEVPVPEQTRPAGERGADVQRFVSGRDIPGDWWKMFGSQALSDLVNAAFAASPDVEAAKATLKQAQANTRAANTSWFPTANARLSADRVGISSAILGQEISEVFTLSTGLVTASYPIDVFGTLRKVEASNAQALDQRFQLEAAYLTLSSNIVVAAIQEASLRAQIAATEALIATKRRLYRLIEKQFELGGATMADVLAQQSALAQSETNLPPLRNSLEQQRTLLRNLAGRFPSDPLPETFSFADLRLPEELPVSLPSSLVEQRPDIRSADAQLRAAYAQVGIAVANMLPQISLSGVGGRIGISSVTLGIWDVGITLSLPIFDAGKLIYQRQAADAGLDAAKARYRSTVLHAFRNVADSLQALQSDADSVAAQRRVERIAAASLNVAEKQFEEGSGSVLGLLNAQTQYDQAKIGLIQAEARRLSDTAALYQALGGGWWNRPGPETPSTFSPYVPAAAPAPAATQVSKP